MVEYILFFRGMVCATPEYGGLVFKILICLGLYFIINRTIFFRVFKERISIVLSTLRGRYCEGVESFG